MRLACICIVVTLSACSVPELKQPLIEFSDATENAESILIILNDEVTKAYAETIWQKALNDDENLLVRYNKDECGIDSTRCRLILTKTNEQGSDYPVPEDALRNMLELMGAIRNYANGLVAIVEADTAAKIENEVNKTLSSVVKLSELTNKDANTSEYSTPAGQIVNWFVGQYITKIKHHSLKRATLDAQPIVEKAVSIFEKTRSQASNGIKIKYVSKIGNSLDKFDDEKTQTNLEQLIDSVQAYDQYLIANSQEVFNSMVEAHNVLVGKIQGGEISIIDVIHRIKEFAKQAENASRILKTSNVADK